MNIIMNLNQSNNNSTDQSVAAGSEHRMVKRDERFYTVNQGSDLARFLKEGLVNKKVEEFEALEIICRCI